MIIDVHAYIGRWPHWPVPVSTPAEVLGVMDAAGIDRAVISSTRALFTSWTDGNAESGAAAAQSAGRFVAFDTIGPPEFSHTVQGPVLRIDGAVRGLRIFPQYHTYHLLYEPFVDSLCEEAAARQTPVQLPLRILMNWGMPMLDLSWIVEIVERHPRVPWILTGLNYFHELRVGLSLMRRYPSVHLESSCIQGFEAIRKIVEQCGSYQLLFGSGLPLQNAAANVSKVRHARISEAAREAIFSLNAQRLLSGRKPV
jgi:predicted TIM-barrel fold metal-dependent hydrolase